MPERNSINREKSTVILRRSPRFLQKNSTDKVDPKNPKSKSRRIAISASETRLFSSTRKVSLEKTPKPQPEEVSIKLNESDSGTKSFNQQNIESRRSARLNRSVESSLGCKTEKKVAHHRDREITNANVHNSNKGKLEKRAKRRSCSRNNNQIDEKTRNGESTEYLDKRGLSDEHTTQGVVNICKHIKVKSLKNKIQSCCEEYTGKPLKESGNGKCDGFNECSSDDVLDGGVLSIVEKPALGLGLSNQSTDKLEKRRINSSGASSASIVGGGERKRGDFRSPQKQLWVKRKINEVEEGNVMFQGWTKDQELALERAYFSVNPTPHFWKKVAMLVPGKSANDCFDKVHSDHLTPPHPEPRSRAKGLNSLPPSLSPSKLLNSPGSNRKRPRHSKQKSHIAQRTVRHMLQKQCQVNPDSEIDLFSILEPTLSPSTQALQQHLILSTPVRNQEKVELLKRCQERSSSAQKKPLSRFSGSHGTSLVSPPVLKQVKNKALHEKYIDQLHCREAKRKVASAKAEKIHQGKGVKKESPVQRKDAIKAAKNALVFDARDAINQFQHLQANAITNCFDNDGGSENDEDEVSEKD